MTHGIGPRTRRDFLAGLAGSALAPLEARTSMYGPLLAAQTTVWLPLSDNPEPVFYGIGRAGYSRVVLTPEFTSPSISPSVIPLLHKYKLEPTAVQLTGDPACIFKAAEILHAAGSRFVEVVPEPEGPSLHLIAAELERIGLRLLLRKGTDTAAGAWIDVDAVVQSGGDPVTALDRACSRLYAVTLRSRARGELLEEVGPGEPDMTRIAAFLRRIRYDGLLVIDLPPVASRTHTITMALSHSRWYVHEVFGCLPGRLPVDFGPHVRTRRK